MNKVPIIINKIEKIASPDKIGETRQSKKLKTEKHLIRELYNLRKSYY